MILKKLFSLIKKRDKPMIPSVQPRYIFDIQVMDEDDKGNPLIETQHGIKANSANELHALYKTCGQRIKIVSQREVEGYTPPPVLAPHVANSPQATGGDNNVSYNGASPRPPLTSPRPPFQPHMPPPPLPVEPKYVTVSGISMKIVGDVVYQKQWVRASDEEANNIRLVSDATNKIVKTTDRHFEIQKWVIVADDDDTVEDIAEIS